MNERLDVTQFIKQQEGVATITMDQVQSVDVEWLWYPYIPFGKVTIVQGDPGEGKTTMMLAISALLTRGLPMPECDKAQSPMKVIYQTAEDGLADTVKPRLEALEADCGMVVVILEDEKMLSLQDERIEQAIIKEHAKLLILDPLQAYLGETVDMHRANEVRPAMSHLAQVAERTGCAIVLIGHMNKGSGQKGLYRGLGSVDFAAAARSILIVGRDPENESIRAMAPIKSSLAPEGNTIAFEMVEDHKIRWIGYYDLTVKDLLGESFEDPTNPKTKQFTAEQLLREILRDGSKPCSEVYDRIIEQGIGKRTIDNAKKSLGIISVRQSSVWEWKLP